MTARRLLLIGLLLTLNGCDKASTHTFHDQFFAMGTVFELTLYGVDEARGRQLSQQVQGDVHYMDNAWHAWKPGPLGRVNQLLASGEEFSVNPSILPLIVESKKYYTESGGLFNPALGELVAMWGFHRDDPSTSRAPAAEQLARYLRDLPTMDDVEVRGIRVQGHNPHLRLDFGGIAKGYADELLLQRLQAEGVDNAIVSAGGNLKVIGRHGDRPWSIAIRNPYASGALASLEVEGPMSVITSGNYERFFMEGKHRYTHILDPRTGKPVEGTSSVTVMDPDATRADAASTALFIAGPEHWWEVARAMGIHYVVLVDDHGGVHMNPEMAAILHLEPAFQNNVKLSAPLGEPK